VFRLIDTGLELIEVAPGIDIEKDILAHMAFRPKISPKLTMMDARIFSAAAMGLHEGFSNLAETQAVTRSVRDMSQAEQISARGSE
jgi:acyl CoA:acetate/3-ketoacid CoA transferase